MKMINAEPQIDQRAQGWASIRRQAPAKIATLAQ